ncbi:MAG: AsmA family protein, partial [Nitrospirales bacterium]|nr:AsmA family protein [Nitrospirales bacterium]
MVRKTTQTHWVRNTLVTIAILLAVMAILVAGGLAVLNSQWALDLVESKLTEQVGQQVKIGSFELELGQQIRVRIAEASVANPSWASNPFLASVDALEVWIDPIELLGGDLLITDIQTTAPVVHLERSVHGRANWAMGNGAHPSSADQEDQAPRKEESAFDLPRIESLVVTGGRLTYSDIPNDISLALSFHSRDPGSSPDQNRLVADGGGHIVGQPMTISMTAESVPLVRKAENNRFPLEVQVKALHAMMHIKGKVDALLAPETANLQIRVEGQNLSQWDKVLDMELPA